MKKLYTLILLIALSAMHAWAFEVDYLAFNVDEEPSSSNGNIGSVTCTGLSQAGKNGTDLILTMPTTVKNGSSTYNVKSIANRAFNGANNLVTIVINKGVETVGTQAFYQSSLTTVVCAADRIRARAFSRCYKLTTVTLGEGVKQINESAFLNDSILAIITIPKTVTSISSSFVDGCPMLYTIMVDMNNPNYRTYYDCLYNADLSKLIRVPQGIKSATVEPSDKTKEVGARALAGCGIQFFTMGYGSTTLGDGALENCPNLEQVIIPSSVNVLGSGTFKGCPKLRDFFINHPTSLYVNLSDFIDDPSNVRLHVPTGMETDYQNDGWRGFKSYNEDHLVAHDDYADGVAYTVTTHQFQQVGTYDYRGRVKVVRGNSIAFSGEVNIPDFIQLYDGRYAVTCIDDYAVGNTGNDYSITGCNLVDSVGNGAFGETQLTSITLPRVKYIGEKAFYKTRIESFEIPNHDIFIGKSAFTQCSRLKELMLPDASHNVTWSGAFFGYNSSDFRCYVDNSRLASMKDDYDFKWTPINSTYKCCDALAPYFTPTTDTYLIGALASLKFNEAGIKAYSLHRNGDSNVLEAREYKNLTHIGSGYLLTDLTPGQLYKIPTSMPTYTEDADNLLQANTGVDPIKLNTIDNSYRWLADEHKFVKPTAASYAFSGGAYLVLDTDATELNVDIFDTSKQGDVNGDGTIDVTDVNLAINVMLGKATKAQYPAADVNGDGQVDVSDVNLIINSMLAK